MLFSHFPHSDLKIITVLDRFFEENCFLLHLPDRSDCVVVDPGLEPEKILQTLQRYGLRPAAILNTHGHADHIAGNQALKALWPDCPLLIGKTEAYKLTDPQANLSRSFGLDVISPPADVLLADGQHYSAAGIEFQTLAIPGHSAGHVVYLCQGVRPWVAFVGDVIFQGSIGRTDFPDGNFQQLRSGIHQKLFSLPEDTVLLPGHGPPTTVGEEKRSNPFVGLESDRLAPDEPEFSP